MAMRLLSTLTSRVATTAVGIPSRSVTTSALMKEFRRDAIAKNRADRAAKREENLAKAAATYKGGKKPNQYTQTRKTIDTAFFTKGNERVNVIEKILADKPWETSSWFFRDWTQLLQSAQRENLWQQALMVFQAMRDNNVFIEKPAFISLIKTLELSGQYVAANAIHEKLRRHYSLITLDYLGNKVQPDLPPFELPNLATFVQPQNNSAEELVRFIELTRYYGLTFTNTTWYAYIDHLIATKNWELLLTETYTLLKEQKLCDGKIPTPFAPYRLDVELKKADHTFNLKRQVFYKIVNAAEHLGNYSAALDLCLMYRFMEPSTDLYLTREYTDILVRRDFLDATGIKHEYIINTIQHHLVELRIRRSMEKAMAKMENRPVTYNLPENINTKAVALSSETADILLLTDRTYDGSNVQYYGSKTQKCYDLFKKAMHRPIKPIIASQSSLSEVHKVVDNLENQPDETPNVGPELTLIFPREDIMSWCDLYAEDIKKGKF